MSFEDWTTNEIEQIARGLKLRRPTENQSFYKYVSLDTKTFWSHLVRTLNEQVLVGSTINSLNDPFEGRACVFDDLDTLVIKPSLAQRLEGHDNFSEAERATRIGEMRDAANKYLAYLTESQRIVSFCERSDSPLLWSHYARNYSGACLHFVGRAFRRRGSRLGYVNYGVTRPMYPLRLAYSLSSRTQDPHR